MSTEELLALVAFIIFSLLRMAEKRLKKAQQTTRQRQPVRPWVEERGEGEGEGGLEGGGEPVVPYDWEQQIVELARALGLEKTQDGQVVSSGELTVQGDGEFAAPPWGEMRSGVTGEQPLAEEESQWDGQPDPQVESWAVQEREVPATASLIQTGRDDGATAAEQDEAWKRVLADRLEAKLTDRDAWARAMVIGEALTKSSSHWARMS